MSHSLWKVLLFVVMLLPVSRHVFAELPPALPDLDKRYWLTQNSGYIFCGTVTAVARIAPTQRNSVATMRITFHVDTAMRGVRTGQTLVIHEWAGVWDSGDRYRVGERLTLFLYPPSKLGLTSPVGGSLGRFRVDPRGRVVIEPRQLPAYSTARERFREDLHFSPRAFASAFRLPVGE